MFLRLSIRVSDGGTPEGTPLLQYADDITFFIQGSENAARTLFSMMDIFSNFFGLQLNKDKSIFVGFGLSTEEVSRCAQHLATLIGALPIQYLGLLLVDRWLRLKDWQPVLEKVEARLGGWQARVLSRGGQLVFVKAAFSAIPTYFMSIFWMPTGYNVGSRGSWRAFSGVGQMRLGGLPWPPGAQYAGQSHMVVLAYATFNTPTRRCWVSGWSGWCNHPVTWSQFFFASCSSTPWTGACGRPHAKETPPLLRASEGFSRSSGLILGHMRGMGHISNFGRMTGASRDAWMTLSPASMP